MCTCVFKDVTDVTTDGLQYWFKWPNQNGKFVEEDEAIEKWPRLVYDYFVANLQWFPANNAAQFFGFTMGECFLLYQFFIKKINLFICLFFYCIY